MPPQELSNMIIDYLYDDKAALCSAGLVCKSWFPTSRFHLFSHIMLPIYNVRIDRLPDAICAKGSTIPPYILHLKIVNRSEDALNANRLLVRLPPLRNLKSLSLQSVLWTRHTRKYLMTDKNYYNLIFKLLSCKASDVTARLGFNTPGLGSALTAQGF